MSFFFSLSLLLCKKAWKSESLQRGEETFSRELREWRRVWRSSHQDSKAKPSPLLFPFFFPPAAQARRNNHSHPEATTTRTSQTTHQTTNDGQKHSKFHTLRAIRGNCCPSLSLSLRHDAVDAQRHPPLIFQTVLETKEGSLSPLSLLSCDPAHPRRKAREGKKKEHSLRLAVRTVRKKKKKRRALRRVTPNCFCVRQAPNPEEHHQLSE